MLERPVFGENGLVPRPKPDALTNLKNAVGVYQQGALEVTAKGLKVNAAKLREPDLVYEADFAWVKVRNGAVSLFFGKQDLNDATKLRTRLEIRFPFESFIKHFWQTSREFHVAMREYIAQAPGDPDRDRVSAESMQGLKDHSQRANFNYIARYGTEAALDFYYLGPTGVASLAQGLGTNALHMDPVARVQITTQELLRLLDQAEPLVANLTAQLPLAEREDDDDDEGNAD